MYTCPVCGYQGLRRPPQDFLICSSCGTEFGYDDSSLSHEELRARWIGRATPWFSQATPPPVGWSSYDQMKAAGLKVYANTAINATSSSGNAPLFWTNYVVIHMGAEPELKVA
jgi:hypothetical protein